MSKLSENYTKLFDGVEKLRDIRYNIEICCDSIRDEQLNEAIVPFFKELGIEDEIVSDNPIESFNKLRKMVLKDGDLEPIQKLQIVKRMI